MDNGMPLCIAQSLLTSSVSLLQPFCSLNELSLSTLQWLSCVHEMCMCVLPNSEQPGASTLSSKLTCANYHRLGVVACAGEGGSRARNAGDLVHAAYTTALLSA